MRSAAVADHDCSPRRPEAGDLQLEVKALVGLGRIDEVAEHCERSMSLRAEPRRTDWQPCGQAIAELSAHGHLPAAQPSDRARGRGPIGLTIARTSGGDCPKSGKKLTQSGTTGAFSMTLVCQ